jgi:hypothetical protein
MELRRFLRGHDGDGWVVTSCKTLGLDEGHPPPGFLQMFILREMKWSGINSCRSVDSERVGERRLL